MHRARLILALAAGCVLAGCERPPAGDANAPTTQPGTTLNDVKERTQQAATAAADYVQRKRDEFMQQVQPQLDKLEERYEQAKERLSEAARQAQPEVEKRMEELRQKVREARQQVEDAAQKGGEAWEQAKQRLHDAMQNLRDELDKVAPTTQPAEGEEAAPATP
jgi:chromosome segregation ATPase